VIASPTLTTTGSWIRRHSGQRSLALALAIWHSGYCEASVYEAPGCFPLSERVRCDTAEEAMERADRLLKTAYPHDCDAKGCAAWTPFDRA
jgi:hypothetical protein